MTIRGRAETPEAKSAIAGRILRAWQACPELRLGQFIFNAARFGRGSGDPFYVEDEDLAARCEVYAVAGTGLPGKAEG